MIIVLAELPHPSVWREILLVYAEDEFNTALDIDPAFKPALQDREDALKRIRENSP
jgi:hypothetical protein